ncbi:MAG: hypothetical protein AAFO89_13905 [Planctomycetota bacterium]
MLLATMRSSRTFRSPHIWGAAWVAAAAAGMGLFHRSMHTPGEALTPPAQRAASQTPTVMFFAHPHCGCTTPMIDLLAAAAASSRADVAIVFTGPAADNPTWCTAPNARKAKQHDHLRIVHDPDSRIAEHHGARTSGHTVIYAASGDLAFAGGLSPARGMTGPSLGIDALNAVLSGRSPNTAAAPVFGCRLTNAPARSANDARAQPRAHEGVSR